MILCLSFIFVIYTPTVSGYVNYSSLDLWTLITVPNAQEWAPSFWDTSVLHEGNPSIRQEGYKHGGTDYWTREINRQWTGAYPYLTVAAGDEIYFSGWVKSDPNTTTPQYPQNGVRFGIDFWNNGNGWQSYICWENEGGGVPDWDDRLNNTKIYDFYVPMNSDWTYREINFTIPTGAWGTGTGQIQGMAVWLQVWMGYDGPNIKEEMGDVWFSDTVLTINEDYVPPYDPPTDFIFEDTFESGNLDKWTDNVTSAGDTVSVVTTDPYNGVYHFKASCSGDAGDIAYVRKTFTGQPELYSQAMYKILTALPASGQSFNLMTHYTGSADISSIRIYNDAGTYKWQLYYISGVTMTSSNYAPTPALALDTWYHLELHSFVDNSAGAFTAYLNGTEIISVTGLDNNNNGTNISYVNMGERYSSGATAHMVYVDNAIVDESYIGFQTPENPENTYTLSLTITNPQNTTYGSSNIFINLTSSGNDTSPVYSWNVQFPNSSWLYGSYQSTTSDTITIAENMTNALFTCFVIGANNASDSGEVYFSVSLLTTYVLSISINAPLNSTYTTSIIPVDLSNIGNETNPAYSWNYYFPNGTALYGTNKTVTSSTMTITENVTSGNFACYAIGDHSASDYASVMFTVEIGSAPAVLPSVSVGTVWQFLFAGDFVGFFYAMLASAFSSLTIGIAIVSMLFLVPLYLRTKSLMLLVVAWLLIGSFLVVLMPEVAALAVAFISLGIGGLFWRLLRPSE